MGGGLLLLGGDDSVNYKLSKGWLLRKVEMELENTYFTTYILIGTRVPDITSWLHEKYNLHF